MVYPEVALEELKGLQFNNDWSNIVDHKLFWSNIIVGRAQRLLLDIDMDATNGNGMCGYPMTLGIFSDKEFDCTNLLLSRDPSLVDHSVFALPQEPSILLYSYKTKENGIHYNWNGARYIWNEINEDWPVDLLVFINFVHMLVSLYFSAFAPMEEQR